MTAGSVAQRACAAEARRWAKRKSSLNRTGGTELIEGMLRVASRSRTRRSDSHPSRYGCVVITGAHVINFTRDPERVRAFVRDVLGFASVDAGGGWLIFALPPAELAVHPAEDDSCYELYLMCDDIEATVDELKRKGVEFTRPISDERWGLVTAFALPGGGELALYEPRHPTPPATTS
jgi:predicted enzyme related to lactoylglutathione lyase